MTNWRATYARRFRRVAIERPSSPIGIKSYAEWKEEKEELALTRKWWELVVGLPATSDRPRTM